DTDGLDVCGWKFPADVRGDSERLVRQKLEWLVPKFIGDQFVQALGVAGCRRKGIDDQKVDTLAEYLDCFIHKGPDGVSALLVAWRNEFDDPYNLAAAVTDDHTISP